MGKQRGETKGGNKGGQETKGDILVFGKQRGTFWFLKKKKEG